MRPFISTYRRVMIHHTMKPSGFVQAVDTIHPQGFPMALVPKLGAVLHGYPG
jgi:hypothetical protein